MEASSQILNLPVDLKNLGSSLIFYILKLFQFYRIFLSIRQGMCDLKNVHENPNTHEKKSQYSKDRYHGHL